MTPASTNWPASSTRTPRTPRRRRSPNSSISASGASGRAPESAQEVETPRRQPTLLADGKFLLGSCRGLAESPSFQVLDHTEYWPMTLPRRDAFHHTYADYLSWDYAKRYE